MSNASKTKLLSMPFGTAQGKLRKALLFKFVQRAGEANCYRCGDWIFDIDVFTVEHKKPWGSAKNPVEAFFDLDNVAFSHMKCNYGVKREDTHCSQGHEYTEGNTYRCSNGWRQCRQCHREKQSRFRAAHPEQSKSAYKRKKGWV